MNALAAPPPTRKELKVMLPQYLIVKLHAIKVLSGRQMSDVLAEALDRYFVEHPVPIMTAPGIDARARQR